MLFQKSFMSGVLAERESRPGRVGRAVGREVASLPLPPEFRLARTHTLANHNAPRPQRERGPDIFLHKIRWARPCGEIKFHTRRRFQPCSCAQLLWSGELIFKGAKVNHMIRLMRSPHSSCLTCIHLSLWGWRAPSAMTNLTTRQMLAVLDTASIYT